MTWAQTHTGRALDFALPVIERQHLYTEVAHGLAVQPRYSGATCLPFSIAQHSVIIAESILDETNDPILAAIGLLHDGHETYFGDLTSPASEAIGDALVADILNMNGSRLVAEAVRARHRGAIARVKRRLDMAIFAAAGLPWPRYEASAEIIASYDVRALRTERDALMHRPPAPWGVAVEQARPLKLRRILKCWPWPEAEDRFRDKLDQLLPAPSPSLHPIPTEQTPHEQQ